MVFSAAVLLAAAFAFSPRALPEFPVTGVRIDTVLVLGAARAGKRLVAAGERGSIFVSDDDGRTWRGAKSPVEATLTALYFHDPQHGWAVGHDLTVLRTGDSGDTWQLVHSAPQDDRPLLDIRFQSPQHGFAIGAYGTFLESQDGGRSWHPRKILEGDRHLNALAASGDGRLFIAGESGTLLSSPDSGALWTPLSPPYRGSFFGILAIGAGDLTAYGLRGNVYHSPDQGQNWHAVNNPSQASLLGGRNLGQARAVLVGQGGNVLVTRDGGRSFTRHHDPSGVAFAAVLPAGNGDILGFGERGVTRITGIDRQ
jgi:photosystem II stability/assembly factor-like uncharacterized protein